MSLPYLIDNTLPGEADIEVTRYEDGITISLIDQYTEHVNLTNEQSIQLGYTLLALARKDTQS